MGILIAIPPRDEQDKIVEVINDETTPLGESIGTCRREIELIREYRTRLIADVVTGKLDVRAAAAGLPAEAMEEALWTDEDAATVVEDTSEEWAEEEPA